MKTLGAALIAVFLASALSALDSKGGSNIPLPPPARAGQPPVVSKMETDRNDDGVTDYLLFFDQRGRKEHEEFDFDFDGKMDDFLYYADGELSKEEIDSNFDGKVDIWVYLVGGMYIKKYERDLDGDGIADMAKDFGDKK